MIYGGKVILRAIEKEDLKQLKEWRNLPEFRKHFREYKEINDESQEKWYNDIVVKDDKTIMFSIKKNDESQELLGCCGLCYINWIHRFADLSLYIGWGKTYIDNQGYAEEACLLLLSYGFGELGLHKIWTEIYEFDYMKKQLYDRLGFKQDGLLRENYFYDNHWWDSRILSLLSKEFFGKP